MESSVFSCLNILLGWLYSCELLPQYKDVLGDALWQADSKGHFHQMHRPVQHKSIIWVGWWQRQFCFQLQSPAFPEMVRITLFISCQLTCRKVALEYSQVCSGEKEEKHWQSCREPKTQPLANGAKQGGDTSSDSGTASFLAGLTRQSVVPSRHQCYDDAMNLNTRQRSQGHLVALVPEASLCRVKAATPHWLQWSLDVDWDGGCERRLILSSWRCEHDQDWTKWRRARHHMAALYIQEYDAGVKTTLICTSFWWNLILLGVLSVVQCTCCKHLEHLSIVISVISSME